MSPLQQALDEVLLAIMRLKIEKAGLSVDQLRGAGDFGLLSMSGHVDDENTTSQQHEAAPRRRPLRGVGRDDS